MEGGGGPGGPARPPRPKEWGGPGGPATPPKPEEPGGPGSPEGPAASDEKGAVARAGVLDLVRLGARLGSGKLRRGKRFDAGAVVCRWAREVVARGGGGDLEVHIPGRTVDLVTRRDRSHRILSLVPGTDGGYGTGSLKREAMTFLAPGALTIADGERWARLRELNERVLCPGEPHPLEDAFLARVREAFRAPVRDLEEVRGAMGRAMVDIVLGEVGPGDDPAGDVRALFDAVQSPLKRKLLGFRYNGRRERLYALLGRLWDAGDGSEPTLLGRARSVAAGLGDLSREDLLQQIPHWMFTFTGSGSDLLGRTMALVTARTEVHGRVLEEIEAAGDPTKATTVDGLRYLDACLREAGRLFPPVTRTFHHPAGGRDTGRPEAGDGDASATADGGPELVHYFPLLQRDPALGPSVHAFRPERWLAPEPDPPAAASNLFLRGPRACPGEDLILFVCRAAMARQLGELGMDVRPSRLSRDPLPVSFPEGEAHFITQEES